SLRRRADLRGRCGWRHGRWRVRVPDDELPVCRDRHHDRHSADDTLGRGSDVAGGDLAPEIEGTRGDCRCRAAGDQPEDAEPGCSATRGRGCDFGWLDSGPGFAEPRRDSVAWRHSGGGEFLWYKFDRAVARGTVDGAGAAYRAAAGHQRGEP